MNFPVLYTAAHAEFPDTEPLGGGKAVADYLIREWRREQPFPLTVLSPRSLGMLDRTHPCPSQEGKETGFSSPPEGLGVGSFRPLTELGELEYARFSRQFERAATAEILKRNPHECVVLSNDISEGPNFSTLAKRGYRIVTIFHVDVVEYFTKFYLRGFVKPESAAKWSRYPFLPDVLRLVFQKQHDCVHHSARIVVPSAPMRETIRRCYPSCPVEKTIVLPWGNIADPVAPGKQLPQVSGDEFVIMTLSRLSPEKGIERLLAALPFVTGTVRVWICGAPAYMKGKRYERKLRRMADGRVMFLGHVTGPQKTALLQRADLFVSPSLHESYGLTIAEAQAAGCRVISHNHYGAAGQIIDCSNPSALAAAINAAVDSGRTRKVLAAPPSASQAAERLAALLVDAASHPSDFDSCNL